VRRCVRGGLLLPPIANLERDINVRCTKCGFKAHGVVEASSARVAVRGPERLVEEHQCSFEAVAIYLTARQIVNRNDLKEGFAITVSDRSQTVVLRRRDVRVVEGARLECSSDEQP